MGSLGIQGCRARQAGGRGLTPCSAKSTSGTHACMPPSGHLAAHAKPGPPNHKRTRRQPPPPSCPPPLLPGHTPCPPPSPTPSLQPKVPLPPPPPPPPHIHTQTPGPTRHEAPADKLDGEDLALAHDGDIGVGRAEEGAGHDVGGVGKPPGARLVQHLQPFAQPRHAVAVHRGAVKGGRRAVKGQGRRQHAQQLVQWGHRPSGSGGAGTGRPACLPACRASGKRQGQRHRPLQRKPCCRPAGRPASRRPGHMVGPGPTLHPSLALITRPPPPFPRSPGSATADLPQQPPTPPPNPRPLAAEAT